MHEATKAMKYQDILHQISDLDEVSAMFVIDRVGYIRAFRSNNDQELASEHTAIISACLGAMESMGQSLETGSLHRSLLEFQERVLLLGPVSTDALLLFVAEKESSLGMLLLEFQKTLQQLRETTDS